MPTENYSHMVMENKHMVDGDDGGDDGGKDGIEIPLFDVESRTNLIPETKIVVVVALCFAKDSVLVVGRFSGYTRRHAKGGGEMTLEAKLGQGGAVAPLGHATNAI